MSRNVEIKAYAEDIEALETEVALIATSGPMKITQHDTFFKCVTGRLKLREFSPSEGELIFYQRQDQAGPKKSFYIRTPTDNPGSLRQSLNLAYGQAGRVSKRRTLYMIGRTRVHLDRVDDLGNFLELEVVLQDNEPLEAGLREAEEIMSKLRIPTSRLIESAYVDLLAKDGV